MYDFTEYNSDNHFILEKELSPQDLEDMKFAFIEFLYYFLREDVERIKKSKEMKNNLKVTTKKKKKRRIMRKKGSASANFGKKSEPEFSGANNKPANDLNDSEVKKYIEKRELLIAENLKTEGTKNFRALEQSDLPDALVYFLQHNTTIPELCIVSLEVLNYCVMYIKLVEKFCTLGLLKDIVSFILVHFYGRRHYSCYWPFLSLFGSVLGLIYGFW